MLSYFTLALFVGMSHALEADHVAAVSSMAARQTRVSTIVRMGAVWGLGHTLTLMAFGGAALVLGLAISENLSGWLEFSVGVMLVGLGGHILYRLARERVHFHVHRHTDGVAHFHAHSHAGESQQSHDANAHEHEHRPFPVKALMVGMMHGMAGSAALLVLTATTAPNAATGLAYVTLFGVGSMLGMATLSAVIAVPVALSARLLTWGNHAIQAATGMATVGLGVFTMYETQLRTLLS